VSYASRLKYDLNSIVKIQIDDPTSLNNRKCALLSIPMDIPISIETILKKYVDLQSIPSRDLLECLSNLTECPPEKKRN